MRLPFFSALLALVILAAAGLGVRAGLWTFPTGFLMLRVAYWLGLAAAFAALIVGIRTREVPGSAVVQSLALVIGLTVAYLPWSQLRKARSLPFIHDVTTDTADPPVFVAIAPLRADAPNGVDYGGEETAAKQRAGYPEIRTLRFTEPAGAVFTRVQRAVEDTGWELVASDSAEGRIEATATTFWFGFKDDVVLRVRPDPAGGARLDMRSMSRVGGSDVGANAARIARFLARVRP